MSTPVPRTVPANRVGKKTLNHGVNTETKEKKEENKKETNKSTLENSVLPSFLLSFSCLMTRSNAF
jgi:hypothetical protein